MYYESIKSLFQLCPVFFSIKIHKQQSRGDVSRHTWHRQESDESSDSIPDEVRSEPNAHSRNFPRSHTFPTTLTSPGASPASASATSATTVGQDGAKAQSSTQRRHSGPAAGCFWLGGIRGLPLLDSPHCSLQRPPVAGIGLRGMVLWALLHELTQLNVWGTGPRVPGWPSARGRGLSHAGLWIPHLIHTWVTRA
ncbi:hypothetical protein XENOCAPTIV_020219 [Xenoophorus captivus]|uniref:Uncharacterized protein n=1 Tax=Xenoophorus captivus TaxID=1517983 RepID=A0ABV0RLX9_9TELE